MLESFKGLFAKTPEESEEVKARKKKLGAGQYLASGANKHVYVDKINPDRVVIIGKESISGRSEKIKRNLERYTRAQFYLTKILHFLFPKNIPNISLAAAAIRASRRTRIEHDSQHSLIQGASSQQARWFKPSKAKERKSLEAEAAIREDPHYIEFLGKIDALGIGLDKSPVNFTFDSEGNIVYLDELPTPFVFDTEKLRAAILEIEDPTTQRRALNYLERIRVITEEVIASHRNPIS